MNQQRELGRRAVAEDDRGRVQLEWSCADDDDPLDPAVWARDDPHPGPARTGCRRALLARQAETMGTDAFAREYLCRTVWSQSRRVIAADAWAELPYRQVDGAAVVGGRGRQRPARRRGGRRRPDGDGVAVKVLEQRPGVDWVAGLRRRSSAAPSR